jgi:agmatinase
MQSFSTPLFAGAGDSYHDAGFVIFGVPYDGTVSFKAGTRDGPSAVRAASWNIEPYFPYYNLEMPDIPVHDMGDLFCECLPDLVVAQVADLAADICRDGKVPVLLGGEHSVTIGAVQAVKPAWYVVLDAHLDLQDTYRGSPFNHDCVTARIQEITENIVIIGARSGTFGEFQKAGAECHLFTSDEVAERGMSAVLDDVADLIGNDSLYLSVDADAIDCCLTPGLGTPEPFGLTPQDVRSAVRRLCCNATGFDYVEVLPSDQGQTAMVAAHMIREFIAGNFHSKS